MDVGALLRAARETAELSQRRLAERANASQPQIAAYESGSVSPTVATLNRLLAACGLQLRPQLEPLLAEVDARVDAMISSAPAADPDLLSWVLSLDDDPAAPRVSLLRRGRRGAATWALDGHTALQAQGLAATGNGIAVAVVLDEAARFWLREDACFIPGDWLNGSLEELQQVLRAPVQASRGRLRVRLVDELPTTLAIEVPDLARIVRVATVDEVAKHWPEQREVLNRLRERRGY